jgi:hypothetical protein
MEQMPLIYPNRAAWRDATQKRIALIGMSGLGKTYISTRLRDVGDWFHYSVDYRIGTRYMGEHIVDDFKRHAMETPFLRQHLMSDSIYIGSNITFENLAPLSAYLGKPGAADKGGLSFDEYMRRQNLHREGEIAATCDTVHFMARAKEIYGYPHFVCDTSGSICEVVDAENPDDPVLTALAQNALIVWIKGHQDHVDTLIARFEKAPKPMYTRADAMVERWGRYLQQTGTAPEDVDPDAFTRWSFREILTDRLPRYKAIADNWGVTIDANDVAKIKTGADVLALIGSALPAG